MKKILLLTTACAAFVMAGAQTIRNGNFENWNSVNYDEPASWKTTDQEEQGTGAVTKLAAGRTGSAIQLSTVDMNGESVFGFFTNTDGNPIDGEGGVPYSQQPTALTGYYKCNIVAGDSAIFLLVFKKQGNIIFQSMTKFAGSVSSYQLFTIPVSLGVVPDSVIVAAASGNVEAGDEPPVGSTITFDDLLFTGSGITQQLANGGFETWTAKTAHLLVDWSTQNNGATRTTDKYKGTAAAQISTYEEGGNQVNGAGIMLGRANAGNFSTVYVPYNKNNDTLIFWYKYTSVGGDSAAVNMSFKLGNTTAGSLFQYLSPVAQYTRVAIPLTTGISAHDSMSLYIGINNQFVFHLGSTLVVDEITIASEPLNTGVKSWGAHQNSFRLYPNPCSQALRVEVTNAELSGRALHYVLNDVTGKVVGSGLLQDNEIDMTALGSGIYFMALSSDSQLLTVKKVIKE